MDNENQFYEELKNTVIEACINQDTEAAKKAIKNRSFIKHLQNIIPTLKANELGIPEKGIIAVASELQSINDKEEQARLFYEQYMVVD